MRQYLHATALLTLVTVMCEQKKISTQQSRAIFNIGLRKMCGMLWSIGILIDPFIFENRLTGDHYFEFLQNELQ